MEKKTRNPKSRSGIYLWANEKAFQLSARDRNSSPRATIAAVTETCICVCVSLWQKAFNMKTILILILCLESGVHPVESVMKVTGYVGRSAVIRCPYDKGYEGHSKYLCKGSCPVIGGKDIPVRAKAGQTEAINGRFSLHDDTSARVFTVTITGLTTMDSGQYWCVVKTGFLQSDIYTELMLEIFPAVSESPPTVTESVTPVTPLNSRALAGSIVGVVLVLITVGGLLLFHLQKRRKVTHTLDHLSTITKDHQVSYPNGTASQTALSSSSAATSTPPQIDHTYCPLKAATATASPDSVYETMSGVPVGKAKAAMTSSVWSIENEYVSMGHTAAPTLRLKESD